MPQEPQKPGRKRTIAKRQLDRLEILQMVRRGFSLTRIAEKLGVSYERAQLDFKIIIRELREQRSEEIKDRIALIQEEYSEVKQEAWEAWERSKENRLKVVTETSSSVKPPNADDVDSNGAGVNGVGAEATVANGAEERTLSGTIRGSKKYQQRQRAGDLVVNDPVTASLKPTVDRVRRTRSKEGRLPASEYLRIILDCLKSERELEGLDPVKEINMEGQVLWDTFLTNIQPETPDVIEAKLQAMTGGTINGALTVTSGVVPVGGSNASSSSSNDAGGVLSSDNNSDGPTLAELGLDGGSGDASYPRGTGVSGGDDSSDSVSSRPGVPVSTGPGRSKADETIRVKNLRVVDEADNRGVADVPVDVEPDQSATVKPSLGPTESRVDIPPPPKKRQKTVVGSFTKPKKTAPASPIDATPVDSTTATPPKSEPPPTNPVDPEHRRAKEKRKRNRSQ